MKGIMTKMKHQSRCTRRNRYGNNSKSKRVRKIPGPKAENRNEEKRKRNPGHGILKRRKAMKGGKEKNAEQEGKRGKEGKGERERKNGGRKII